MGRLAGCTPPTSSRRSPDASSQLRTPALLPHRRGRGQRGGGRGCPARHPADHQRADQAARGHDRAAAVRARRTRTGAVRDRPTRAGVHQRDLLDRRGARPPAPAARRGGARLHPAGRRRRFAAEVRRLPVARGCHRGRGRPADLPRGRARDVAWGARGASARPGALRSSRADGPRRAGVEPPARGKRRRHLRRGRHGRRARGGLSALARRRADPAAAREHRAAPAARPLVRRAGRSLRASSPSSTTAPR